MIIYLPKMHDVSKVLELNQTVVPKQEFTWAQCDSLSKKNASQAGVTMLVLLLACRGYKTSPLL